MAERTEFAFVVARITASQAAVNRTPEGRSRVFVSKNFTHGYGCGRPEGQIL